MFSVHSLHVDTHKNDFQSDDLQLKNRTIDTVEDTPFPVDVEFRTFSACTIGSLCPQANGQQQDNVLNYRDWTRPTQSADGA